MLRMGKLLINAKSEGYNTEQVGKTMTVGELIEALSEFPAETPVYLAFYGYRTNTFGAVYEGDIEFEEEG